MEDKKIRLEKKIKNLEKKVEKLEHLKTQVEEQIRDCIQTKEESEKNLEKVKQTLEKKLQEVREKLNNKRDLLFVYDILGKCGVDYEAVEKEIPTFLGEIIKEKETPPVLCEIMKVMGRKSILFVAVDLSSKVGCILTNDWYYYGEYGVTLVVWRDGKIQKKYYKYRDPYDYQKNNYRYAFEKVMIKKVTEKEVEVELESFREGKFSMTDTFVTEL